MRSGRPCGTATCKALQKAIDDGADVNARNEYGVSALWIAAGKGKLEVIELLVNKGADVNARDDIWYQTPLSTAVGGRQLKTVKFLIKAGAKDVDAALSGRRHAATPRWRKAILDLAKVSQDALDAALYIVSSGTNKELKEALEKAGAKPLPPASEEDRKAWAKPGRHLRQRRRSEDDHRRQRTAGLVISGRIVKPTGPDTFAPLGTTGTSYRVERKNGELSRITMKRFTAEYSFYQFKEPVAKPRPRRRMPTARRSPRRSTGRRSAGRTAPASPTASTRRSAWDVKTGESSAGRRRSPASATPARSSGATACSSPPPSAAASRTRRSASATTATSPPSTTRASTPGRCSASTATPARSSGRRTAFEGVPKIKRHLKGSQANCTPATDGRHVVACFGSEGLYCYDFDGKLLWKRDLSTLDSSFALDREYEWGFGNSPVIHDGPVHPAVRPEPRLVHRRIQPGGRLEGVVHAAGRDSVVEFAGHLAERQADRDRDQRRPVRPRLRPDDRGGAVAAGQEVGGDRPDAGARQGPGVHHQRQPADPADHRHPARGDRRHLA